MLHVPRLAFVAMLAAEVFVCGGSWPARAALPEMFDVYLAQGHREVSKIASRNGGASSLVAEPRQRAAAAAAGNRVLPLLPSGRTASPPDAREANFARVQLLARLESGARQHQPLLAAIAQVNFDCWIDPLPKRLGVPDGDDCRRRFYFAFVGLRTSSNAGAFRSPTPDRIGRR